MRKNDNKGFTLIELLAIIVILAIIAVITVPIILNIIEDAKQGSVTDSAYGYKKSLQYYSAYLQTIDSTSNGLKGSYIVEDGNLIDIESNEIEITLSGTEPDSGTILIDNDGISGCLQFDEYASYLYNNEVENTSKGICPTERLVTTGDGLYKSTTEPGRLIYRGATPNNRIFLKEDGTNDTLYRIVSYETDGTIKVVRNEKLATTRTWDTINIRIGDSNTYCSSAATAGCNVWGDQTNTLYNGTSLGDSFHYFYYTSPTATTLTNGGLGKVGAESTLNIYLNSKITNSEDSWQPAIILDNYIDTHKFKVGGVYYSSTYKNGDKGIPPLRHNNKCKSLPVQMAQVSFAEISPVKNKTDITVPISFRFGYHIIQLGYIHNTPRILFIKQRLSVRVVIANAVVYDRFVLVLFCMPIFRKLNIACLAVLVCRIIANIDWTVMISVLIPAIDKRYPLIICHAA